MEKSNFLPTWYIKKYYRSKRITMLIEFSVLLLILFTTIMINIKLKNSVNECVKNDEPIVSDVLFDNYNYCQDKNEDKIHNIQRCMELDNSYKVETYYIENDEIFMQLRFYSIDELGEFISKVEDNFLDVDVKVATIGDYFEVDFYGGALRN